ncbi:MAG: hypothetical protein EU542_05530 [Promethearchaeota archaeon]|nr:MAG: hypothetical protein EU542_05530 [Candidatus Lokiarchaeota archaeon]
MSEIDINNEFYKFGKNIQIVAGCTILSIIPYVSFLAGFGQLIFIFLALGNIKNVIFKTNNRFLYEFRSKFTSAFILRFFGMFFVYAGLIGFFSALIYAGLENALYVLIAVGLGFVLLLISGILEMGAWKNFKKYLEETKGTFPEEITTEAIEGSEKLQKGALMFVLGFLIVTLVVGTILQLIGYLKLAKFNQLGSSSTKDIQV